MNEKILLKFKVLAFILHFAGFLMLLLVFSWMSWMQTILTSISNSWLSNAFLIFCILYLSAVTLRIHNGADPGPRLLQHYFGRK